MKAAIFFVFCLLAFASTQKIVRLTIDDFTEGFTAASVTIPSNPSFPIVESATYTSDDDDANGTILGGERTVIIEVDDGSQARQFQSIVDNGIWDFSTPSDDLSSGSATLQIDGKDDSRQVDVNGLGGIDITEGGLGESFIIRLRTDVDTTYTFFVYSTNGDICQRAVNVPGQQSSTEDIEFLIDFSDFSGDCSFTDVGALEINVFSDSKVDSTASFFGTFGDEPQTPSSTPSPSRTQTPVVEPSETRTPAPSSSRTPTPSPEACMCHCPVFTCALIFDPDDDENNAYYFDDDDEIQNNNDDDDDDDNNDDDNNDDGSDSSSDAMIMKVTVTLIAILAVLAF